MRNRSSRDHRVRRRIKRNPELVYSTRSTEKKTKPVSKNSGRKKV